jgi:hypothetical protein
MSEFEEYDLRAWVEDGLTHHLKIAKKIWGKVVSKRATNRSGLMTAGAAAAIVGLATSALPVGAQYAARFISAPQHTAIARMTNERAASFWRSVRADVRRWKMIEERDVAEPPELL